LKYIYEDVLKSFKERGYTLLTTKEEYKGVTQKLRYICNKHKDKGVLEITYSKFMQGRGCVYCGRERTVNSRTKPFDYDEAVALCLSHNFEFVDIKRENSVIYIYFICNQHRELGVQKMRKTNMKRDIKGCKYCKGDLPEWYVKQKIADLYPHIKLIGKYVNMSTPLECHCEKHDVYWKTAPQNILYGHGCIECGKEKLSEQHTYTKEEFENLIKFVNPDVKVIGEYRGMEYDVIIQCKKCGHIWTLNAQSLKANGTRCKKCSYTYKGEDEIIKALQEFECNFIHQYKIDDCKDKRPLPFDFYLPDYNLCIEFDGEQHYKPKFGESSFMQTQKHDNIKNEYCKTHNIKLLRIPYWDGSNIKQIIQKQLNIN
jgi:very-short-patch-repair endonuclease